MKKIYVLLSIAGFFSLQGCGDFLEEESQSEVIPQTTEDFSELLIGSGYPDQSSPSFSIVTLMDDDCALNLNNNNAIGHTITVKYASYYSWQPTESDYDGHGEEINTVLSNTAYYDYYRKIMGCNAVLDNIDDAIGTQAAKDRVKAEALTARALLYFQLVNLYGEPYNYNKEALGVPLKLDANLSDAGIRRATVGEVYENVIVPDLQLATKLMDPLEIIRKNFRINQPSIHILLSRVYLYMERYQECIEEVDKAERQGIRLMNLLTELDQSTITTSYNALSYDVNPEVEWLFGPGTQPSDISNYYWCGAAPDFRAIWDYDNDLRTVFYGLTLSRNTYIYKPRAGVLSQTVRSCEAFLNRMEAMALLGRDAQAMNELNSYRKTRIKGYENENLTGTELLEAIRTERRKELCFEGHRWFDLRRYGMPEISHLYRAEKGGQLYKYTLKKNDPLYTLPLPKVLFEYNTELVQNSSRQAAERVAEIVNE